MRKNNRNNLYNKICFINIKGQCTALFKVILNFRRMCLPIKPTNNTFRNVHFQSKRVKGYPYLGIIITDI